MPITLHYGTESTCELDSAEINLLQLPHTEPLDSDAIVVQLGAKLEAPLEYPSLSQATIPGDQIVLAIQAGIPQLLPVITGTLQALRSAGAEDSCLTVLLADSALNAEQLHASIADEGFEQCQVKVHDPDNEKEVAFLGVTRAGLPLRLNRELCDADFVLPIGVSCCECDFTWPSFASLYPAFSDRETIERLSLAVAEQLQEVKLENVSKADYLGEIEECGRHLGVASVVQIIPSTGGQIADIIAGNPDLVTAQASLTYRQIWNSESPTAGNLVIATVSGDSQQQTWLNVGRALAAATKLVEPGGAVVICSELSEPPGKALSQLAGAEDHHSAERVILRTPSADSRVAMQICQSLQQGPIYLRSQLCPATVEGLGMTPLDSDSELERLTQSLRPCIAIEEAQRVLPAIVEIKE